MLLRGHALKGGPLAFPNLGNVEQHVGLPIGLFRLVGLEKEYGRRTQYLLTGTMPVCLSNYPRFLRRGGGKRVIVVVRIFCAVCEYEFRVNFAVNVRKLLDGRIRDSHR